MRLKRFKVDDLKRRMATLDGMKSDLERKLADLEDSIARERQRANDSDIGRLAFPSFLRSIESRRENLRATLKEIERERAVAQDDLAGAYQDLKASNWPPNSRPAASKKPRPGAPRSQLDEMALVRHLRKHALRQA